MNEYYSEIIDGLTLSEQQHCQIENALLTEVTNKNNPPKKEQPSASDDPLYQ
jgi:hypothetical protein